jgi:DNA-binding response OmpR family regulator
MRLAAPWGSPMSTSLSGRTILIVEDEPLIAIDIIDCFERAGASVAVAGSLAVARDLVDGHGICAAIVDFGLSDGNASQLCELLNQRHVPFVLHSGYAGIACEPTAVIPKPAHPKTLVDAVGHLLGRQACSKQLEHSIATPS